MLLYGGLEDELDGRLADCEKTASQERCNDSIGDFTVGLRGEDELACADELSRSN